MLSVKDERGRRCSSEALRRLEGVPVVKGAWVARWHATHPSRLRGSRHHLLGGSAPSPVEGIEQPSRAAVQEGHRRRGVEGSASCAMLCKCPLVSLCSATLLREEEPDLSACGWSAEPGAQLGFQGSSHPPSPGLGSLQETDVPSGRYSP